MYAHILQTNVNAMGNTITMNICRVCSCFVEHCIYTILSKTKSTIKLRLIHVLNTHGKLLW